jgi:undecaprenyl-diphosphatase
LEFNLSSPYLIIFSLIFWGIGLILADKYGRSKKLMKDRPQTLTEDNNKSQSAKFEPNSKQSLKNINLKQAIIIGLGQCLALIPGTSRSGVTTIFGIISGLTPQNALRYSFLTGIPLIGASGSYAVLKLFTSSTLETPLPNMALATLVSFGVGLTAAYILKKFINKNILSICGIYRIILGFGILAMIW